MLRIHFTADDLARIRVRAEPHPLWEVLLSMHLLQSGHGSLMFDNWRRQARSSMRSSATVLATLAPPKGYSPDFLTPTVDSADLETALETLLSTAKTVLRSDIELLAAETRLPTWVVGIADGDANAMRQLANSIRRYHEDVLQPHWQTIRAHVRADRNKRAELTTDCGIESMLTMLHPTMKWRAPILEIDYPVEHDIYLQGRGLTLMPSFFCWQSPVSLADPERQPILVYPVERELGWCGPVGGSTQRSAPRPESLIALLGRTRANVLRTIAEAPRVNTSELAKAIGISVAGASQHATVLRDAGLVITHRANGAAVHKLSSRGASLLAVS
ncbi:winged helix-turn-helix domain-containing protein [Kibdelosporangium philippinense]|uniref:Winged helix-turn-helix domain-containing protein n=1 Tax=Kibdelosporangium philippinense TaxID=211113 RepID=A0ABS8Z3I3_9PSEU|nr:winged helix-turn-helix domain-containing protein [Kibdelosporangium philippinense]MCE7001573.1 winged helix-turn-helix domain-containing protein [Kibdelosporangium philippinense]